MAEDIWKDIEGYEGYYQAFNIRIRGRWIDVNDDGTLFECSICKYQVRSREYNYCPRCGSHLNYDSAQD